MSRRTTLTATATATQFINSVDEDYWGKTETETQKLVGTAALALLCAAVSVILLMVIGLIVKLAWEDDDDGREVSESTKLVASNAESDPYNWYGSIGKEDLETGRVSCSSSSSSLWKDLYDKKLCAICYEHQRKCFFVPCGHCVSCRSCAKRIMEGEMKNCPICRESIGKIRKLS